jgi:hypothetical protein
MKAAKKRTGVVVTLELTLDEARQLLSVAQQFKVEGGELVAGGFGDYSLSPGFDLMLAKALLDLVEVGGGHE